MTLRKVYFGDFGPFLVPDDHLVNDPDGDFSGEYHIGVRSEAPLKATEFQGIPVMGVSVVDIDDPSAELNVLSASAIGGLVAAYQVTGSANDPFTMYLWDTDAAAENVPYSVDGSGGTWVAVAGKYRAGDVYVEGDINYGGSSDDQGLAYFFGAI